MSIKIDEVVLDDNEPVDGNFALGKDEYRWISPDSTITLTFGRVKGLASLRIARILGPMQANNPTLELYYKAIAGIRTWNGEPFQEPMTEMQYDGVFNRFGDENSVDQNLTAYVNAWQISLFPELAKALEEAGMMGLGPDAQSRIAENAGKETAKKSQRHGSSRKS